MKIAFILVLCSGNLLDYIELSSPSESSPNGAPIPIIPRNKSSALEGSSPIGPHSRGSKVRPASLLKSSPRERTRSPPVRSTSPGISVSPPAISRSSPAIRSSRTRGITPEEMRYVRLIPHKNPNQQFEIRKYTFPPDALIRVRGKSQVLAPMPTEEQTVLATSKGDIFAIFRKKNTILGGIYTDDQSRVKINMHTSEVEPMTIPEMEESPLSYKRPVSKNFERLIINELVPR